MARACGSWALDVNRRDSPGAQVEVRLGGPHRGGVVAG